MTNRERKSIRRALELIMGDGERFQDGIFILSRLAHMTYPVGELKDLQAISIFDLAKLPNQDFCVKHTGTTAAPPPTP